MATEKEHPDPPIGMLDDGKLNVVTEDDPFLDEDDVEEDETEDAAPAPRRGRNIVIHR